MKILKFNESNVIWTMEKIVELIQGPETLRELFGLYIGFKEEIDVANDEALPFDYTFRQNKLVIEYFDMEGDRYYYEMKSEEYPEFLDFINNLDAYNDSKKYNL